MPDDAPDPLDPPPTPVPLPDFGRPMRFATTRWSIVLTAGGRGPPAGAGSPAGAAADGAGPPDADARAALAWLCSTYWYPLYAYVRRRGHDADDARDLTQSFFARLLEKDVLHAADPDRGRFRSFLLTALKHFLANERERDAALKRGGGVTTVPLVDVDFDTAERRYAREPAADALTPERIYERGWALTLLDTVLGALGEQYQSAGKADLFDRLKPYLTGDAGSPPYADTAAASGLTEGAVQVAVHRLRKRYRDLLRTHIGQTVASPAEVDEEIRDLFRAVQR